MDNFTNIRQLGISFLTGSCLALFVGIQVMFEIRQSELRKGIDLKC